ncbi:MAG: hypothetical protein C0514_05040 [Candidatus Puniceispirillum sp.]|nr:hypothetical protein [Candidatus Puniceispirillum sp.]
MVACLLTAPFLLASSEEYIFTLNDQAVFSPSGALGSLASTVEADTSMLELKERKATHCSAAGTPSPMDQAQECYRSLEGKVKKVSAPTLTFLCPTFNGYFFSAVTDGVTVSHEGPVTIQANFFYAEKDVSISGQSISLQGVFCASKVGKISLKAPEGCPGWLRSLTFERAPGERPFDMMFQGCVSFNPPSIENLIVVGANKVTFGVQRLG